MRSASALIAVFVLLSGFTIGTNVVDTLGSGVVPAELFTLGASIDVLLFTGVGILLGSVLKMSTSTSQTAVAAVVGMGAALGALDWRTVGVVVLWWMLSTILAFWVCAVGRCLYDAIVDALDLDARETRVAELVVVGISCYMPFSAGGLNVANAVAPLVGSGQLGMLPGVAVGGVAIGVGAFTIGPRTMETVGEDITDLSLEASLIAEVIAASVLTGLSWAGIPASLAVVLTTCVIGLGWGRASRRVALPAVVRPGGLVVGYLLRVWEKISIYERILQEAVSREAETQVEGTAEERIESGTGRQSNATWTAIRVESDNALHRATQSQAAAPVSSSDSAAISSGSSRSPITASNASVAVKSPTTSPSSSTSASSWRST